MNEESRLPSSQYSKSSEMHSTMTSTHSLSNFKDSYESLKHFIIDKLTQLEDKKRARNSKGKSETGDSLVNNNRIELLNLNRCSLSNGKILW